METLFEEKDGLQKVDYEKTGHTHISNRGWTINMKTVPGVPNQ